MVKVLSITHRKSSMFKLKLRMSLVRKFELVMYIYVLALSTVRCAAFIVKCPTAMGFDVSRFYSSF